MTVYVLCTNDFSGAWDPAPARFGLLPGGRGLRDAVQALKSRGPAIWADAGDLVDGGALFAAGGDQAWLAGATLGIDGTGGGNFT